MRAGMLRQLTREPALAAGITFAIVPPALMHFFSHEKVMWSGLTHALFVELQRRRGDDRGVRADTWRPRGAATDAAS